MIMEINEAIERIKGTQPFTFGRGPFADAVETLVDFAEWYGEQDLIRREDAYNILYDEPIMDVDGTCYGMMKPSLITLKERLTNIPKAEPPKMRDANSEEIKNINDYLKSISKPTGVYFEAETLKENR